MGFQRLVGEHARGADFHEIAAEFVFENAVFVPSEVDVIVRREDI